MSKFSYDASSSVFRRPKPILVMTESKAEMLDEPVELEHVTPVECEVKTEVTILSKLPQIIPSFGKRLQKG